MNEDREEHKAREHGVNYGMYREIGEIRGREMAESLARVRAAFEGISKGMAAVGASRKCDEGRLDLDTAYECAMVEYVWRMRQEATLKGRLSWKSKAMDYCNEWNAARGALRDECTARRRAEKDRDEWRCMWEKRGDRIQELNATLAQAQEDRDEYKARWELRGEAIRELGTDLERAGHSPECRDKAGEVTANALRSGRTCAGHGGDLLRERNDAIACTEITRKERDALRSDLKRTRLDLYRTRRNLERSGYTGRGIDGYLMVDSPVTPLVKYVYRLGEDDRATGPVVASVRMIEGWWEPSVESETEGSHLDRHTDPEAAFAAIRRYLGDGA